MFPALHGQKNFPRLVLTSGMRSRKPKQQRRRPCDGDGNITQKVKSLCFKLYRDYLLSFNSQDVGNFFLELNSKRPYRSSGKEKETLWHFANSLINPIAYTCRLSSFRKTLNGRVQRRQVRVEKTKLSNEMSLCRLGHLVFFLV